MMKKRCFAILTTFLFSACDNGYHTLNSNGGYTDTWVKDSVYKITYESYGVINARDMSDFILLRAAELTLEKGYNYFIILDALATEDMPSYPNPLLRPMAEQMNTLEDDFPPAKWEKERAQWEREHEKNYSDQSSFFLDEDIYRPRESPYNALVIKCFKEPVKLDGYKTINAQDLRRALRVAYKMPLDENKAEKQNTNQK